MTTRTRRGCRLAVLLCCLLILAPAGTARAGSAQEGAADAEAAVAGLSLAAAINTAGRQRMLSQRILKMYAQAGLGVRPKDSRAALEESIALFEAQLAELKTFAPISAYHEALAGVERVWRPFRTVAGQEVSHAGAARLLYWNEDLLHATNKVVRVLQDLSDLPSSRLINVSGRQRMLSQRLAMFYMLREWGFDTLTIQDDMESARNEFAGALDRLGAAPDNTPVQTSELEQVELLWLWFESALDLQGEQAYRLVVSETSDRILEHMDKVTKTYEEMAAP